jgi:hypothetical protein
MTFEEFQEALASQSEVDEDTFEPVIETYFQGRIPKEEHPVRIGFYRILGHPDIPEIYELEHRNGRWLANNGHEDWFSDDLDDLQLSIYNYVCRELEPKAP